MTRYVFDSREVIRYRFPTHTNDLIMDRRDAATSEAFFVILEPGEAPPLHVHDDAEQVFFVLEGDGLLSIGRDEPETFDVKAGDFVRTPPGTYHAIRCTGTERFVVPEHRLLHRRPARRRADLGQPCPGDVPVERLGLRRRPARAHRTRRSGRPAPPSGRPS